MEILCHWSRKLSVRRAQTWVYFTKIVRKTSLSPLFIYECLPLLCTRYYFQIPTRVNHILPCNRLLTLQGGDLITHTYPQSKASHSARSKKVEVWKTVRDFVNFRTELLEEEKVKAAELKVPAFFETSFWQCKKLSIFGLQILSSDYWLHSTLSVFT